MVAANSIGLRDDSIFRSTDQVPLLKNPTIRVQAREEKEDSGDEEKSAESPKIRELSWQIDSHVVVLNDDQPRTGATAPDQTTQPLITINPLLKNPSTEPAAPASIPPASTTPRI